MRDYAEIAHNLRCCGVGVPCDDCTYQNDMMKCRSLEGQAADAIEELLAERDNYKAYFDNVSSLPDCNVCLKQGVCEFVPAWGENTRINCPLALTEPPKEESK